jgi:hypothetical protein
MAMSQSLMGSADSTNGQQKQMQKITRQEARALMMILRT